MSTTHGRVWWSELVTGDVDAARDHYGRILGWQWQTLQTEAGPYAVAHAHGRPVAGVTAQAAEGPAHWLTYVAVDDLEAAQDRAVDGGGALVRRPVDIPGVGRLAVVADAAGARLGLIDPASDWDPPGAEGGALDNVPV